MIKTYEIFANHFSQIVQAENVVKALEMFDAENKEEVTGIRFCDNKTQEENKSLPIDEKSREDFCLWYYAQPQPLSAHIVFDHFKRYYRNLPNEQSIDIRSISEKWVGIWQRGENPNLFQCVDEAIKETLKVEPSIQEEDKENIISIISSNLYNISNQSGQHLLTTDKCDEISEFIYNDLKEHFTQPKPLQEDCHCTPDQTTGHTAGKCNVCGKDVEEAAIQHADSLHKKGSSELAGNGKLTENDCWENSYFNFKEGSKVKKVEVKWEDNMK